MRWTLLTFLLPLVLAVPQDAVLMTIHCNKDVDVYYNAVNGTITLFYTESPSFEVAKTFYTYFKLLQVIDKLTFVNDATITSIRSLSDALAEYQLQLLQAESLAHRYGLELNLEELNRKAALLKDYLKVYSEKLMRFRNALRSFLEKPDCKHEFSLGILDDFHTAYVIAKDILDISRMIKTDLTTDENVDLKLADTLSELITPPFKRSDIDELLSRMKRDKDLLTAVINPPEREVYRLLELDNSYKTYEELKGVLNTEIVTEAGVFHNIDQAITFIQVEKDKLKKKELVIRAVELYRNLKTYIEEGKYEEALYVAKKLRTLIYDILKSGYEEEPSERKGIPGEIIAGVLVVLLLILFLIRRQKHAEDSDEPLLYFDDDHGNG